MCHFVLAMTLTLGQVNPTIPGPLRQRLQVHYHRCTPHEVVLAMIFVTTISGYRVVLLTEDSHGFVPGMSVLSKILRSIDCQTF